MRSLIAVYSYHHNHTERIARVIAKVLDAEIRTPQQVDPEGLRDYGLIGFGSGIYGSNLHKDLLTLAEKLPKVPNGKAFIFSTSGAPSFFDRDSSYREAYTCKYHTPLRERLQSKGYTIVGEFGCAGHNSNSFLKLFGWINKDRPNAEDLKHAEEFGLRMMHIT
jgi:flavodoxin